MTDYVPITDAGDFDYDVEEETAFGFRLLGCTILSNYGSLLTIKLYLIKVSSYLNQYI